MASGAVSPNHVDHIPVQLDGKATTASVENIQLEEHHKTDLVLKTFRCLIADLCHQFGCGHPG
jgi:dihydroxyacetone synthase